MNRVSLVFSFVVLKIFHHSKFSWCADEEWLGKFYETVASFCYDCGDIVLREKILQGQYVGHRDFFNERFTINQIEVNL